MPHKNLFSKQGVTNIKFDTNEYSNIYLNKKQSQRISEYICIKKWYKRISGLRQARPLVWLQASEFQGPWFTSEALVWLLVHYSTFCYLGMKIVLSSRPLITLLYSPRCKVCHMVMRRQSYQEVRKSHWWNISRVNFKKKKVTSSSSYGLNSLGLLCLWS